MQRSTASILVSILAFSATVVAIGEAAAEMVIVAFGDSTTAPRGDLVVYATVLERSLSATGGVARVINAGVGGNTTADARVRFEKDVLARNPGSVIIQFGLNDASVDVYETPPATQPRVSMKDYEANLRYFVQTLKHRKVKVVLMTPNPCRWTKALRESYGKPPYRPDDPDGYNVLVQNYAETVRRISREERATLVDVYQAFQTYGKQPRRSTDDLLLDGMHPNAKGHELVARLLLASKQIQED
jgi:lysophospholipase L1-like esterase